jgi:triacylglycerol lipase
MRKRARRGRNPGATSESEERDLEILSRVQGRIGELDRLGRSVLFAEISMVSYLPTDRAEPILARMGFGDVRYIERDGAEVFVMGTDLDVVVACRGTEPNEWNDIRADVNARTEFVDPLGPIHRGFKREVDDIWPHLEELLEGEDRTVWFTGHSLGGAMATICASRCTSCASTSSPVEVVTFGSPRVGTRNYLEHAGVQHVRWVNNNDIVTRMPPTWLGYRHTGVRMYIDRHGELRATTKRRADDRWAGFVDGIRGRRFDHFSDHAIKDYVRHLTRAARRGS